MGEADLIRALSAHGFSLNESRAYAALLAAGPSTGYEVGQRAQIPRSAVYGALRRLVSAGAARSIPGHPERFVAAPSSQLISLLRDRFDVSSRELEDAVRSLDSRPQVPDAYSVRGYSRIMEEARQLVSGAAVRLVLAGWPREIVQLETALREAVGRRISIVIFSHAALPPSLPGTRFSYNLDEAALEAFWHHRLVVVADDRRSLIGATEQNDADAAVISETTAIAEIATSQVALDITLLAQRHGYDTSKVMAEMLGDRVGRLDSLLPGARPAVLGERVR